MAPGRYLEEGPVVGAGQQALSPLPVLVKDIQAVLQEAPVLSHVPQRRCLLLLNPGHCLPLAILQGFPQEGKFAQNHRFEPLSGVLGEEEP